VHVRGLARDHFGGDDPFLFRLVREQLAADRVTNSEDVRYVGAHLVIDHDLPAAARGDAERGGVDACKRGTPSD
jgi:hypothetical protein